VGLCCCTVRQTSPSPPPSQRGVTWLVTQEGTMRILTSLIVLSLSAAAIAAPKTKTENFDRDPGWEGVNNRSAQKTQPRQVRQDFGYSASNHAGGNGSGEVGGVVSPAGEVAYYAAVIPNKTYDDKLSASGTMYV